ncbi:MAG: hypothetical protein SF029_19980 [bacterium]|nr:hypothetical protein [bacterium]
MNPNLLIQHDLYRQELLRQAQAQHRQNRLVSEARAHQRANARLAFIDVPEEGVASTPAPDGDDVAALDSATDPVGSPTIYLGTARQGRTRKPSVALRPARG